MPTQSYTIPSATTPGRSYRVTVHGDGVMTCDCPDAVHRRRQCKHQRLVLVMWTQVGRSGALYQPAGQDERAAELAEANAAAADLSQMSSILGRW